MTETSIMEIQHLIDRLSPVDQAHVLKYLSKRIAAVVSSITSSGKDNVMNHESAWAKLFRIGDELIESDTARTETLTSTLLSMRR